VETACRPTVRPPASPAPHALGTRSGRHSARPVLLAPVALLGSALADVAALAGFEAIQRSDSLDAHPQALDEATTGRSSAGVESSTRRLACGMETPVPRRAAGEATLLSMY